MLRQTSQGFRKIFLLSFTKQLIDTYAPEDIAKLERILKKDEKKKAEKEESKKILEEIRNQKEKEEKLKQRLEEKEEELQKEIEKKENKLEKQRTEEENKLKKEIKDREKELKSLEKIKEIEQKENLKRNIKPLIPNLKESLDSLRKMRPVLKIPETRLPPTFQYLRPNPTNKEVEIGRLNPLIQDPLVKVIECHGPNKNIIVHGTMGVKPTKIILSKEEIDIIMKNFSEATKIPLDEGIFKAVIGKLIISAIVSDTVGSKFLIRKMNYNPKRY